LVFDNSYDLAMHFLRVQEFYESENPEFRGKHFTIVEYMDWYRKKENKDTFRYPIDWDGFNISDNTMSLLYIADKEAIPDFNKYDEAMETLHHFLNSVSNFNYYLIGTLKENKNVIRHEMAHALYYLDQHYRKGVSQILFEFKAEHPEEFDLIQENIVDLGYPNDEQLILDEMQAYMASDGKFQISFGVPKEIIKKTIGKIVRLFNSHLKKNVY